MDFVKGGAFIAVIIGFWDRLRAIFGFFISIFVQKVEIRSEDVQNEVIGYLINNYKYFKNYNKIFSSKYEYFRNGKYGLVSYEKFGDSTMVFFSNKKIFFNLFKMPFIYTINSGSNSDKVDSNNDINDKIKVSHIVFLRGTLNIEEIIKKSVLLRNQVSWNFDTLQEKKERFNIFYFPKREQISNEKKEKTFGYEYLWFIQKQYKLLGIKPNDLGKEFKNKSKALENLFFPKEIKDLINIIKIWLNNKNWYKEKGIPWKMGWLLYGPPGTGKTALVRAFAEDLGLPIYSYSLAQLTNNELLRSWQSMQLNVPCIALIEDIDTVFDKRKNIVQNSQFMFNNYLKNEGKTKSIISPLTFETLINCIDGVDKSDGVFTIITTNHINKVDEAIGMPAGILKNTNQNIFVSSRPGRIDRIIKLSYMTKENKIKMANKILNDFPNVMNKVYKHISKDLLETPAQFQEYCTQIALKEFWKLKNKNNFYNYKNEN